jgi:glyoxylase-like metal-dependent hydrolase (beta-lactamase superfamily II)
MERWKIGDVEITRVVEVVTATPATFLIPQATPEALTDLHGWLRPHFLDDQGNMRLSIHAFAIRSGDARILVDTCLGNGKSRPMPEWSNLQSTLLEDLTAVGFGREHVDRVLCTHLHFDHVGWNTLLEDGHWVPTFPNARYLVGETEWEFWEHEDDPYAPEAKHDSILPVFEAGLVDLVDSRYAVTDEVRLIPTPGHTPGHVSVLVSSQGQQAVITGDLFHHPLQMAHPDWKDVADVDGDLAHKTRIEFLERYADGPVLILGTHFASPTAGHIVRDGAAYRFERFERFERSEV